MTIPSPNDIRRIIPRWRNSQISLGTGEFVIPRVNTNSPIVIDEVFLEKKRLWNEYHRIEFAADLVASAFSMGIIDEAIDAAEFLVENELQVTHAVFSVAEALLIKAGKRQPISQHLEIPEVGTKDVLYVQVHNLRKALNRFPRNALLWVDIARAYIILGEQKKSRASMLNALFLAPHNRFVLRSAARLFVHLDEPDYAHEIFTKNPITAKDPWLLAAEIATAAVAGKSSKLIRVSRNILENKNFDFFHTAELASALATLELFNGANRNARRLFQTSLIAPTENSVAQSAWAKQTLTSLEIDDAINTTPRTYEAKTWRSFLLSDWRALIQSAESWMKDEPFSSRPFDFASYASAVGLEDYSLAENFSRKGLISNSTDFTLINNLAFSLAKQDRPDDAYEQIKNLKRPAPSMQSEIALTATEGLIYLRKGAIEIGKVKYLTAIELARRNSMLRMQALATIYYAQEMLRLEEFDYPAALSFVENISKKVATPDVTWLFEKLRDQNSAG